MSLPALKSRPILSARYQPKWGLWEAFRELYCNAIDADPSGNILSITADTCTIHTRTVPTLPQLSIIGEGTKDAETGTIGQFGEGFKLAALTLLRNHGSITIRTPSFTANFALQAEEGASAPILYIHPRRIPESLSKPGCTITFSAPKANWSQYQTRFCELSLSLLPRASPDTTRIFFRGVYITRLTIPALHDYNFKDLTINRDRSVPDHYSVLLQLLFVLPASDAHDLLTTTSGLLEHDALNTFHIYTTEALGRALAATYISLYGPKAVLPNPSDPTINEAATIRGYTIADAPCKGLRDVLREYGIKTAESVIPADAKYTPIHSAHAPLLTPILTTYWTTLQMPGPLTLSFHAGDTYALTPTDNGYTLWLPITTTHPRTAVACFLSACSTIFSKPGSLANMGSISAMAAALLHPQE